MPLITGFPSAPPIPPHPHTPMPFWPEMIFTVFLGIPVVVGVVMAVRHLVTGRGPLLLACLIGGGIACLFEPIVDTLGLAYIREGATLTTFSSMGRDFPLFINFVYIWYVGGLAYLAYQMYSRGVTARSLFLIYGMDVCINVFLESPGVLLGAYQYYGPQPLNFWGLPLWWVCVNPLMPMTAGAIIYWIKPHLPGWKVLAVIPVIPMSDGIANGAVAWPMWTSLNLDANLVTTHATWLLTLGLALFSVWLLSFAVARPENEVGEQSKLAIIKAAVLGSPEHDATTPEAEPSAPTGVPSPASAQI
ncbi:hypothetical protein LQ327_33305 [Actinomycetospora endophytica]|uniref:Carotenoid biosynthesis protein n=1 Tax=Actinomycetospora endophytica TaxID=2291215 RepID=A0ABS8PJ24_9PSEU|nr:hypothetical protein [Actinomycetospora endophytica]MCD2198254.1 hypothetical protein [Actinomycetospora endophytica]